MNGTVFLEYRGEQYPTGEQMDNLVETVDAALDDGLNVVGMAGVKVWDENDIDQFIEELKDLT